MEHGNRPFYICVLSYLAINASEAGGDIALIQTSLLFSCKCQLVSIRTTWFAQWVIPEKISIPYHGQHLGIPRERGVSWTGILKAWEAGGLKYLCPPSLPVVGYRYFLETLNKSSEVCIKTRSTPALLPFRGQVSTSTTVKWSIIDQREVHLQNTKE